MTSVQPGNTLEIGIVSSALETDYEVLEELGRGGMAIVYRAREKALDREVAIKVLPSILSFDDAFVERFQREAKTAAQLEHPNIVPIYRVGKSGQVIFFVMKLLRGQSLSAVLRERPKLDVREVRHILLQTGGALGYAATRGVVHRDIKPDNILLDHDGRCVLTDFGIAKTPGGPLTAAGTSMGTPRYMSPEHAQGQPLDGRSDIYSLGVVAYQCLVGSIPFDGPDPFAVLYKHINTPLPHPEFATDDEKELFAIIERMLAKRPEDRFQNADEMVGAIGGHATPTSTTLVAGIVQARLAAVAPTEIIATGPTANVKKYLSKEMPLWAVAAAFLVMATGGYAAFATVRANSSPAAVAAVPAADTKAPAPTGASTKAADSTRGASTAAVPLATTGTPAGSATKAAVVTRPAAPPKPTEPYPTYSAYSKCRRLSLANATKTLSLLIDAVANVPAGSRLGLTFDVCGLPAGAAFTSDVTIRRVDQGRINRLFAGGVRPVNERFVGDASGPRMRRTRFFDTASLPSGKYALEMSVTDANQRTARRTREFEIVDKPAGGK